MIDGGEDKNSPPPSELSQGLADEVLKSSAIKGAGEKIEISSDEKAEEDNQFSFVKRFIDRLWSALKKAVAPGGFFWGMGAGIALMFLVFIGPWGFDSGGGLRQKVALFDYILQDLERGYVDHVDVDRLFETGMNSMLASLDPYCEFKSSTHAFETSLKTNGKYAGVGLGIATSDELPDDKRAIESASSLPEDPNTHLPSTMDDSDEKSEEGQLTKEKPLHRIIVVSAFEGYAFDAGVRPGDVVLSVDNTPTTGMTLEAVSGLLRGEPGTEVLLTVTRPGYSNPMTFTLERRNVQIKNVPTYTFIDADNSIGYIRLQSFAKDAAEEVKQAILDLQASGPLKGLVLDLRSNPGGLLTSAIETAETLLPNGSPIVSTRGRGIGASYKSSREPTMHVTTRLAILVNEDTASASEVVAGAVQDLDAGIIVGSGHTFGKGLVQNLQELPYQSALKYTVGKYYTPSGRCLQAISYKAGDEGYITSKVEDGSRKEFRTASGRVVRDGGGVEADVTVTRNPSFLERALQAQNMYFEYAGVVQGTMFPRVETLPADFTLSDSMYKDFVKFVSRSRSFKYQNRFDASLSQLENTFAEFGYGKAKSKVKELKKTTEAEMVADFTRHEKDIRSQLEAAIRNRFQPDSERLKAELKTDDQLGEAIKVLQDQRIYEGLLKPRKVMLVEEGKPQTDILGSLGKREIQEAD